MRFVVAVPLQQREEKLALADGSKGTISQLRLGVPGLLRDAEEAEHPYDTVKSALTSFFFLLWRQFGNAFVESERSLGLEGSTALK